MQFNEKKYEDTISDIQQILHNVTTSFQKGSKQSSEYVVMPYSEKGKKYIRFNVINTQTHESSVIFISPQTIGIKVYNSDHTFQYDYSISRKSNKQVIKINFADGTSLKDIYEKNPQTEKFDLIETDETSKAADVLDLSMYTDPIVNEDLLLYNVYRKQPDSTLVGFTISYGNKKDHEKDGSLYSIPEHPDLSRISDYMRESHIELIDNYLNLYGIMQPWEISHDIVEFRNTFRSFLTNLENTTAGNPDISDIDADNSER